MNDFGLLHGAQPLTDDPDLQQHDPEKWHALRKGGIGGSDIGKLCGAYDEPNEWNTALAVYESKVGPTAEEGRLLDRVAAAVGSHMEPLLARLYEETTGLRTEKVPMVCDPDMPWRRASADRIAYDGDKAVAVVELKCPTAFNPAWDEDTAPLHARMQCQWYASIFREIDRCDIFALVRGTRPRWWSEPYDPELAALMTQEAGRFWSQKVEMRDPPAPTAIERRGWLQKRYPDARMPLRKADATEEEISQRLMLLSAKLKTLEQRKQQLEDEMIIRLGECEGVKGTGWSFTNRKSKGRTNPWNAMKALAAELAEERGNPLLAPEILEAAKRDHRGEPKRVPRHNTRGMK